MISSKGTYLLSLINHKEEYQLTDDVVLYIDKSYENNLRERNPQLGKVEALPIDNWLCLSVGDVVAVNHFTFFGDIDKDRRTVVKPHVVHNGIALFPANERQIFFKYNNRVVEPLPGYEVCSNVAEEFELKFVEQTAEIVRQKSFANKGVIAYGKRKGTEVLVKKNAFYLITLDGVDYFKVRKDEIVATLQNEVVVPEQGQLLVEYIAKVQHSFLDLSMCKLSNNVTARVLTSAIDGIESGETMQVWRNNGVEYNGKWLIDEEIICWKYEEA